MPRRKIKGKVPLGRKHEYILVGGPFPGKKLFLYGISGSITFGVGDFYGRYDSGGANSFGNHLEWINLK